MADSLTPSVADRVVLDGGGVHEQGGVRIDIYAPGEGRRGVAHDARVLDADPHSNDSRNPACKIQNHNKTSVQEKADQAPTMIPTRSVNQACRVAKKTGQDPNTCSP